MKIKFFIKIYLKMKEYGDWGLGIGDWGFGYWGWGPRPKTTNQKTKNNTPKQQKKKKIK